MSSPAPIWCGSARRRPRTRPTRGLHRFFDLALAGFPPGSLPARRDEYFRQHYLADELTRQQCDLFERALAHRGGQP